MRSLRAAGSLARYMFSSGWLAWVHMNTHISSQDTSVRVKSPKVTTVRREGGNSRASGTAMYLSAMPLE